MYVTDRRIPLPLGCGAELREPQVKEDVSIVRAESPTCINLMSLPRRSHGIHTFVMMPLDFGQDHGWLSHNDALHGVLGSLRHAGVRGVMVDVWWGLCEREPQSYDFGKYLWLSDACRHHGLKLQAVMAFHSCGGNVGDNVNVPLPAWASTAADKHEAWYLERAQKHGADRNGINREYISHGADHCVFLPGMDGLRTPIEAYTHFVEAFCRTMSDKGFAGGTVTEIQVGMGPCGEIRYPSYQLRDGKWKFPGIGELQCFDKYLLASLAAAAKRDGHPVEWGVPPKDTGYYNGRIQDAPFYNGEHRTPRGRFFLRWYSEALVQHCEDVLSSVTGAARAVNIDVACKIAGIHWGYLASVRVPECNAGYLVNDEYCFYDEAAAVLRKYGAVLDFTCLEMASEHQPAEAKAAPRQLVHDVFEAAARAGVPVAGENALECYDRDSFNRVVQAFRWSRADAHGFTLLRLTHTLLEHDNHHNLRRLAEKLRHVNNN